MKKGGKQTSIFFRQLKKRGEKKALLKLNDFASIWSEKKKLHSLSFFFYFPFVLSNQDIWFNES